MSLINDALKKASQAQPPTPADAGNAAPMHPAEHKRPPIWPLIVVPLLLLVVVAVAAWFLFKSVDGSRKATLSASKTTVAARESSLQNQPAAASVSSGPESPATEKGVAAPSLTNKKTTPKLAQPANPPEITKSEVSPSAESVGPGTSQGPFPSLKLQGLFYRAKNPSVVINSKTLFVGDRVEHAKVISIERDRVTLEWGGQTRVLTLE